MEEQDTPLHIIRRIRLVHCMKGPQSCPKCREMDQEAICLLDICPPNRGMVTRRVIGVDIEGKTVWCEFDVLRVFESEEEARTYAGEHGITDVQI